MKIVLVDDQHFPRCRQCGFLLAAKGECTNCRWVLPGNPFSRDLDMVTSKLAGRSDFTRDRERCLMISFLFFDIEPFSAADIRRCCEDPEVQRIFPGKEVLGSSSWHRIYDNEEKGLIEKCYYEIPGKTGLFLLTRKEDRGRSQHLRRLTDKGWWKAAELWME